MLITITAAVPLVTAGWILTRSLPAQNVVLIVGSLMAAECLLQIVRAHPDAHWPGLLFWPAMVLWARLGTRWLLRSWRKDWNYGIWLIVLAGSATALLQFAIAMSGVRWNVAAQQAGVRFAEAAVSLFLLSPWFISKLPQQPQERAQ